jgi:hypothetical protein
MCYTFFEGKIMKKQSFLTPVGYRCFSPLPSLLAIFLLVIPTAAWCQKIIIDHTCVSISQIPESAIVTAKQNLHIAYGHTSHGSQLITGMDGLVAFMNGKGYPTDLYAWNEGGTDGALDIRDYAMGGDVGYYPDWVNNTHDYLGTANTEGRGSDNPDINVIIWSWCGQAAGLTSQQMITNYLTPMTNLENEYFGIKFVYMTGHLDGSGSAGDLTVRNNQIRDYCNTNNKILYDFADIESYDPDGLTHYMPLMCNDNCDYDSDGNGSLDRNWATRWQNTHSENVDWYDCSPAHTQALNGNLKAYAAWWLWARLGGWNKGSTVSCDFNSDGKTDILWRNMVTGQNAVWYMNGGSRTGSALLPSQTNLNWALAGPADFNSDGKTDILWHNQSTGQNTVWYMNGVSRISTAFLLTQTNLNWTLADCADFNSDGKTDILWHNQTTGQNAVWYMNGATRTGTAFLPTQTDMSLTFADCADFNSDGKTDIVWRNMSTGENVVWYMNGATRTSSASLPSQTNLNWILADCADFNSDGKTDILWHNQSTGQNAVWYMNGATRTSSAFLLSQTALNWEPAN